MRERMVLNEMTRMESIDLGKAMISFHAGMAQVIVKGRGDTVETKLWELARNHGLLAYQRLGSLLNPWDESWTKAVERTEKAIYDTANEIADSGLTDRGIIQLVTEFEKAKQRRAASKPNGSKRPVSN